MSNLGLLLTAVVALWLTCPTAVAQSTDGPELVNDNSTYEKGAVPTTGMKAVIVNGRVTVRDDELLPVFARHPSRCQPEDEPRFEPVSEDDMKTPGPVRLVDRGVR